MPPIVPPAYVPPSTSVKEASNGGVPPAPGKWWPPDRRIWAGGLATVISYTILSYLHAWTGIDLNPLNAIVAVAFPGSVDVTGLFATIIGAAIAQFTPPSLHDVVAWLDNRAIRVANADPNSPVTAMIVSDHLADEAAKRDIAAGVVPPDIVAKREGETNG